jgi:hypothetical protein
LSWIQTVDMANFDMDRYVRFHQHHYLRNLIEEDAANSDRKPQVWVSANDAPCRGNQVRVH